MSTHLHLVTPSPRPSARDVVARIRAEIAPGVARHRARRRRPLRSWALAHQELVTAATLLFALAVLWLFGGLQ